MNRKTIATIDGYRDLILLLTGLYAVLCYAPALLLRTYTAASITDGWLAVTYLLTIAGGVAGRAIRNLR